MFITAHATYGVSVSFILFKLLGWEFAWREFWLGLVAGALPDFDMLWVMPRVFRRGIHRFNSDRHRYYFTHKPFFWLVLFLILSFFIIKQILLILIIGVFLHLITDSIHEIKGIRWFYPFSNKFKTLFRIKIKPQQWLKFYWDKWYYVMVETVGVVGVIIIVAFLGGIK